MVSDGWGRLDVSRLEKESDFAFRRRAAEIARIVEGFRMGRYRGQVADIMERRLIELEEVGLSQMAS